MQLAGGGPDAAPSLPFPGLQVAASSLTAGLQPCSLSCALAANGLTVLACQLLTALSPAVAVQAVALMRDPAFQSLALGLLYHISQEERHRTMFTYTDAVPAMHAMLMGTRDLRGMPELIALAVNLTQNARIAEVGAQMLRLSWAGGRVVSG